MSVTENRKPAIYNTSQPFHLGQNNKDTMVTNFFSTLTLSKPTGILPVKTCFSVEFPPKFSL